MAEFDKFALAIALTASLIAAVTDVWKFRVYNVLTFPLFLTGLAYHGLLYGWSGLGASVLGALFGFGILIVPHLAGLMGAGDVKLLAALGAWLGLWATGIVFVVSSLAAGLFGVVLVLYGQSLGETWLNIKLVCFRLAHMGERLGGKDLVQSLTDGPNRRVRVIPYGVTVPLGVVGALVWMCVSA